MQWLRQAGLEERLAYCSLAAYCTTRVTIEQRLLHEYTTPLGMFLGLGFG